MEPDKYKQHTPVFPSTVHTCAWQISSTAEAGLALMALRNAKASAAMNAAADNGSARVMVFTPTLNVE
jgi:hypothetical protein